MTGDLPYARYEHLLRLIDDTGILEHARFGIPRREHGYTTDDAARALVVLCRAPRRPQIDAALVALLSFLLHAIEADGHVHNRMGYDRRWLDTVSEGDHQGRAMWALGVAALSAPRTEWRAAALGAFGDIRPPDGPHLRPHALAALGAAEVWRVLPGHPEASQVFDRAIGRLMPASGPWPEPRLTYANGRIPQALLAMGEATGREDLVARGLEALSWLASIETRDGRFSFTPVGGRTPGEPGPAFDQQPIEAAAMADAALVAWRVTGDEAWADVVRRAGGWLMGANDSGVSLYVPETGGCFDGLEAGGVNANQGAESTIAGLAILQACESVAAPVRIAQDGRDDRPEMFRPRAGV